MRLFGCRKALLLCLNLVCVCAITPSPATAFANEETCKGPCVSQKIGRYFLRLGCFRHFPSTVPQMHLWTRDRHLCDGLSHRQRWTWARQGIAVDESSEIIVVQLQLCAVARHAAKLPVQHAQIWTGAEHRSGWPDRHVQTWSARCAGA